MTTIAWDGINLASDTLSTSGNMKLSGECIKTRRVGKYRIAFAGDFAPASLFYEHHLHEALELGQLDFKPVQANDNDDFTILVVQDNIESCWIFSSHSGYWDEFQPPISIGSGSKYAMGSMYSGCDAEKAVEVSCALDTHSGLPVHVEK
jgi:ATP-dependent protease HslVU (ClpYQ) peptidase subunit